MTTDRTIRMIYSTRGATRYDGATWAVLFVVAFLFSSPLWLAVVVVGMFRGWW